MNIINYKINKPTPLFIHIFEYYQQMNNFDPLDSGLAISGAAYSSDQQRLLIGFPSDQEKRNTNLEAPKRGFQKPPILPLKNQSMAQIERQRSVAAKAGQMQILGNSGEGLMKRGPIPGASFLGNKLPVENPSISSNAHFGDYVGRRQMIEQKREKKTAFMKEMDETELLKFPQSRSVGPIGVGALSRRSMKTNANGGPVTPNLAVNSRAYTMGESEDTAHSSFLPKELPNAQNNFTSASVKEYGNQKRNQLMGSVRQSQSLATQVLGSQVNAGYQSTSNLRGPRPMRLSNAAYQSTSEIPLKSPPTDPNTIVNNDPACRRRQIAALRAHQIMNEQNDARLKAIFNHNDLREKVPSPQYLSQNGFQKQQYKTEASEQKEPLDPEPIKSFDYMFIEMSLENFNSDYADRKIIIKRPELETPAISKLPMKSPRAPGMMGIKSPTKSPVKDGPNLSGLVSVKAYDKLYTSEVPQVSCHLIPSQLDHLKVLICEEQGEKKRLTSDAQEKMENEKQAQVKQYMDDIIGKLETKQRKFKISTKKKFLEDALYATAKQRMASVYVVVVNREKNYDPTVNKGRIKKRVSGLAPVRAASKVDDSSSSDQEVVQQRLELQKQEIMQNRFKLSTNNHKASIATKPSTANQDSSDNSTTASSVVVPRLNRKIASLERDPIPKRSASLYRPTEPKFKWVPPVKVFPEKYGPTKIKIVQDCTAHNHHLTHKINVFFDQANEFVRIMFKNQKASSSQKLNVNYAMGLAKCLGIKANKETFSEQNMKSREHLGQLKEKLIFNWYKKLADENQHIFPTPPQLKNNDSDGDEQHDGIVEKKEDPSSFFKYHIGKGNNSIMVRSLFKNRYWWIQFDKNEMDKVNFMWTQIKNHGHMETLLCKYPDKKAGLRKNLTSSLSTANTLTMTPTSQKTNKKKKLPSSDKGQKIEKAPVVVTVDKLDTKLYNKVEDNFHMANKKALLLNMTNYYEANGQNVFDSLPITFHIKNGLEDREFTKFKSYYDQEEEAIKARKAKKKKLLSPEQSPREATEFYQSTAPMKNIWILKPGENTNCGNGIQVAKDFNEIVEIVTESNKSNKRRTCIVQRYVHNPLLIHRRKFDIRTFAMITSVGGNMKGYVFDEGYIRTSSYEYDVNNLHDRLIHLTNDAIQKQSKNYGKFEPGNKMSYSEFQIYMDKNYGELNVCFERDMVPQINKMTTDVFRAVYGKLDPKRRVNTFEVFGLDFMIDDEFKLFLIEVNTNPCLELSSPLLARLIPNMLENAFKIAVDPIFMPPEGFSSKKAFLGDPCPENKFTLVFDHKIDGPVIENLLKNKDNVIIEMDEEDLSDEEEHPDELEIECNNPLNV